MKTKMISVINSSILLLIILALSVLAIPIGKSAALPTDTPIVLFSLYPRMIRLYSPEISGHILDFQYNTSTDKIIDKQTGSEWNLDGIGVNEPMKDFD